MKPVLVFIFSLFVGVSLQAQSNPVPFLSQPLHPTSAAPGGPGFTLTVNGTGFLASSIVNWNGTPRATHYVSSSALTAEISASDIARSSGVEVTVSNPSPGGGASNGVWFEVTPKTAATGLFGRIGYLSASVSAVASADFNGDGFPDFAVALGCEDRSCTIGGVTILLGDASGHFTEAATYTTGIGSIFVTTADFDGDGKLDLAVLNENCQFFDCPVGEISILLGNGDGTFRGAANYTTASSPVQIIAVDLNGDGKIDLVTANNCGYSCNNGPGNALSVLLGNGDGTFQSYVNYQLNNSNNAVWVAAGDIDKDGKLDLVAVDYCASNECGGPSLISTLKGNGDGTFQSAVDIIVQNYPSAVVLADMNGDGNQDVLLTITGLIIAGDRDGSHKPGNQPGSVMVLLGKGDGSFQAGTSYKSGPWPDSLLVGDFNGDGILDVATSNLEGQPPSVSILPGLGGGALGAKVDYSTDYFPLTPVAGDFNHDGRLDLAVANQNSMVTVLLQTVAQWH